MKTVLQALVYMVAAFCAARFVLGPPADYGQLGATSPYGFAALAAFSALLAYLLTRRTKWPSGVRPRIVEGALRGVIVALIAHPVAALLIYFQTLWYSNLGLGALVAGFADIVVGSLYLLFVGALVTLPVGALAGIINNTVEAVMHERPVR